MAIFTEPELSELAERLALFSAAHLDAEPSAPRASFDDDVLTFSFEHGLAPKEELLRRQFRSIELREHRERLLEPLGARLAPSVEDFAHARVAFHVGLFESREVETMMLFGFEGPEGRGATGERRRLLDWGARVRGEARRLRRESVSAREAHGLIRAEFRAERALRSERYRDLD